MNSINLKQRLVQLLEVVQLNELAYSIRESSVDLKFYKKITDYLSTLLPQYQYIPDFETKTLKKNNIAIQATQDLIELVNNSPLRYINNWLAIDKIKIKKPISFKSDDVSIIKEFESFVKKGGTFDLHSIKNSANLMIRSSYFVPIQLVCLNDNSLILQDGYKRIKAIKNAGRQYIYMNEFEINLES